MYLFRKNDFIKIAIQNKIYKTKGTVIIKKAFILFILLSPFTNEFIYAQFDNMKVNLLAGFTRNFHPNGLTNKNYAFNPEIQLEGTIINSEFNWSVNLGYWDDNINGPKSGVRDLNILFSYSSLNLGTRLYYFSEGIKQSFPFIDLSFLIGLSHNFVSGKNVLSNQIRLEQEKDFGLNIAEIGFRVEFNVLPKINFLGEYVFKYHLNSKDFVLEDVRNSFKIGLSYLF